MTKDMTQGSPLKLILAFAVPLMLGSLSFDGVDPEAISGNYYPLTRNYSFGLNVTF